MQSFYALTVGRIARPQAEVRSARRFHAGADARPGAAKRGDATKLKEEDSMRAKLTLCAALTLALSATGAFAQQLQYDRTGDHMSSYGPVTGYHAPAVAAQHPVRVRHTVHELAVPIDRTGDHMLYYGPVQ